ncbi:acetolactate synthase catalytic subunit [Pseudidiomarina atlantica]|uniref:Acetolactate synthase n=1 Tax=Pseudidiomarina atlantica TaxID=1517416 RepID=A0A094IKI8_9GAMM|nr:acetolactate synthase 2 catalytic subunit [Pseudidiomarina atlantica]KFZ28220.1 acetolactate synthase catalytic subunit [Pseudidiomarina atlantica]
MTGAEFIIDFLHRQQVQHVFGYPGGAIMPIYDALYQSPVQHFLCRHEQGAAFAAIGYARASGKTGVCMATSGPGATNLLTALADAKLDSVPVVAITGQVDQAVMGTDAFQEIDVLGLSLAVTKHSILVSHPSELADALQQAFQIAAEGRPGPVLIDVPKNIQLGDCPAQPPTAVTRSVAPPPQSTHGIDNAAAIALARHLIAQAERPVAYIGGGVVMADAVQELRAFLDATQIPAVSTLKALGSVAPDYPHDLGMLGMHGRQCANMAVQECDVLINLGARFDDRVTGKLAEFAPHAKVIHIDIDAAELHKRRRALCGIHGNVRDILPTLQVTTHCEAWRQRCRALDAACPWRYDAPPPGVYAPKLLRSISEQMPADTVVCPDVGQHQMWVAQHMRFSQPNNHLSSGGLGTMGFSLPAAVGAQIARPEATVFAICGDGSFMMNVQELGTIKRFQLPVKIVIIDNQRLGMVRQWQELFFDGCYSETDLSDNPDFCALARAFGIPALYLEHAADMPAALEQLFASDGPFLLHVRIDAAENVWPLVPPGAANHDMLTEKN